MALSHGDADWFSWIWRQI